MVDKFIEVEFDIYETFAIEKKGNEKQPSPISDLVDSYWIAKCGEKLTT